MIYSKDSLEQQHEMYKSLASKWAFYMDSYRGGHAYKSKNYLTRYTFESNEQYKSRIEQTPLDNHCASIVQIYTSFLFAEAPTRQFGKLQNDPVLADFLEDADREGRSWDNFMKQASILASVYGHAWIIVDRPSLEVSTRQEEIDNGIRPYVSVINPLNVLDWEYTRFDNGITELTFLKVVEGENHYKCYYADRTDTVALSEDGNTVDVQSVPNPYNKITAVPVYTQRDYTQGIGISDIGDISDMQRAIFDENSEIEQIIRLSSHPSLVKTASTQAGAGAGAIIQIDEDMDPGLKPYLLQPDAESLDSIRASIGDKVEAINRMSNVGAIRTIETKSMSGVAMETEFRLLNARLAEKADNLELAEEQVWQLVATMSGTNWDGTIKYPDSFNAHDTENDLAVLEKALLLTKNPKLVEKIEEKIAMLIIDNSDDLNEVLDSAKTLDISIDSENLINK
jgi:hypothetical protein